MFARSGIIEWGFAVVKRLILELPFSFVQLATSRQCCIATSKAAGDMAKLDSFEAVGEMEEGLGILLRALRLFW